jgi:hypothetical protein
MDGCEVCESLGCEVCTRCEWKIYTLQDPVIDDVREQLRRGSHLTPHPGYVDVPLPYPA